jgi:hypothetical protein
VAARDISPGFTETFFITLILPRHDDQANAFGDRLRAGFFHDGSPMTFPAAPARSGNARKQE